jgi:asparagine synthase (glutamine-hydrolysing)
MCGFACLWRHDDEALAKRMIEKIEHRGPDQTQVYRSPNVPAVMAHCRLSIIGPSDGSQPIYAADNILVANGEIYNYHDLRAILGESAFETRSDSETILHLFRSNQLRWVTKLDGMFAFVLATPERIIAARDPLGIKPLYVAHLADDGLAFSSELKAFDGLGLKKIEAIGPGAMFDSLDGTRRWFRIAQGAAEAEPGFDLDATCRELRLTLEDAVRKWMVADVEVGSFLSGGLDSSLIAALAARAKPGKRLKTFSVGLERSPDIQAARRVAEHIGSEHYQLTFTAADLAAAIPQVIYHLESADVDLVRSAIPTHFATTLARQHVKAVLTGEGADELFAGYAYHHDYAHAPRELADELTRSLTSMHNINLQRVDRMTMAQGLEARTPFLDRELIDFAQSIPAELKMRITDSQTGKATEKWILRKACADLLPDDLIWRQKAQFDEGTGTVDTLDEALALATGAPRPVDRATEARLYRDILCEQFENPEMILEHAGAWDQDRVAVGR